MYNNFQFVIQLFLFCSTEYFSNSIHFVYSFGVKLNCALYSTTKKPFVCTFSFCSLAVQLSRRKTSFHNDVGSFTQQLYVWFSDTLHFPDRGDGRKNERKKAVEKEQHKYDIITTGMRLHLESGGMHLGWTKNNGFLNSFHEFNLFFA